MNGYAVDTNIISFMLRGDRQLQDKVYREVNGGKGVVIPPIAYYEIKRGLINYQAPIKLAAFECLCNLLGVDVMDSETLDSAAGIYAVLKKSGCLIEDSDILIAASCLAHGYTLITDNTRHFERIDGLRIVNWSE
ncbi:MAG: PIN domain-containing protein [Oscillospiraceae bacterium]|nr:PIN domain-containing protein [Oscillospiraceae bacterium]